MLKGTRERLHIDFDTMNIEVSIAFLGLIGDDKTSGLGSNIGTEASFALEI